MTRCRTGLPAAPVRAPPPCLVGAQSSDLVHEGVRGRQHGREGALADPVRIELVRELADSQDWTRACGSFDVPVGKAALSHHFGVLPPAGLVEQRDMGSKRVNRLRREEFDARFPGLLALVTRPECAPAGDLRREG
ncbi:helix-turn-helix transcriptional regulator [Streptomyces sp. SCSIO 30461]|uniref:ArsR/SmtB family transcription factor n=1 Tax=Streptomyces sp. SCSIO 30461 TaxID=3118085 RepID=UPI0030D49ED5